MDKPECAVMMCEEPGRPQVCPYDGARHHHGRIHYDVAEKIGTSLTFRVGAWRDICNLHYAVLLQELADHRERQVKEGIRRG